MENVEKRWVFYKIHCPGRNLTYLIKWQDHRPAIRLFLPESTNKRQVETSYLTTPYFSSIKSKTPLWAGILSPVLLPHLTTAASAG
jgi:hypothetical protein